MNRISLHALFISIVATSALLLNADDDLASAQTTLAEMQNLNRSMGGREPLSSLYEIAEQLKNNAETYAKNIQREVKAGTLLDHVKINCDIYQKSMTLMATIATQLKPYTNNTGKLQEMIDDIKTSSRTIESLVKKCAQNSDNLNMNDMSELLNTTTMFNRVDYFLRVEKISPNLATGKEQNQFRETGRNLIKAKKSLNEMATAYYDFFKTAKEGQGQETAGPKKKSKNPLKRLFGSSSSK